MGDIIKKLENQSATDLDGINHKALEVIKIIKKMHPSLLTRVLNGFIEGACILNELKIQKLVLAYKNHGDILEADYYWPLIMLPMLGKLLNTRLVIHLRAAAEGKNKK